MRDGSGCIPVFLMALFVGFVGWIAYEADFSPEARKYKRQKASMDKYVSSRHNLYIEDISAEVIYLNDKYGTDTLAISKKTLLFKYDISPSKLDKITSITNALEEGRL